MIFESLKSLKKILKATEIKHKTKHKIKLKLTFKPKPKRNSTPKLLIQIQTHPTHLNPNQSETKIIHKLQSKATPKIKFKPKLKA